MIFSVRLTLDDNARLKSDQYFHLIDVDIHFLSDVEFQRMEFHLLSYAELHLMDIGEFLKSDANVYLMDEWVRFGGSLEGTERSYGGGVSSEICLLIVYLGGRVPPSATPLVAPFVLYWQQSTIWPLWWRPRLSQELGCGGPLWPLASLLAPPTYNDVMRRWCDSVLQFTKWLQAVTCVNKHHPLELVNWP